MEAQQMITITGGKHQGKTGRIVSTTEFYTTIRLYDNTVVRCKSSFTKEIPADPGQDPDEEYDDYDGLLQQILMESAEQDKYEREKEDAKHTSAMIREQNMEYEASVQQDILREKKPVFEEVSLEEMRRVRLSRFLS